VKGKKTVRGGPRYTGGKQTTKQRHGRAAQGPRPQQAKGAHHLQKITLSNPQKKKRPCKKNADKNVSTKLTGGGTCPHHSPWVLRVKKRKIGCLPLQKVGSLMIWNPCRLRGIPTWGKHNGFAGKKKRARPDRDGMLSRGGGTGLNTEKKKVYQTSGIGKSLTGRLSGYQGTSKSWRRTNERKPKEEVRKDFYKRHQGNKRWGGKVQERIKSAPFYESQETRH